ncbi:MAG: VWA domain-containing protein [Pseudomonas sp.]|uniref:VWA domain-containing protein n=1 Tax=Pseudomonas sp. TaxID=306 RepID=UPI003394B88F
MTLITQGQRIALASLAASGRFQLLFDIRSPRPIDLACFGVDAQGRLSDERYMIFFNQPQSPCGSLRQSAAQTFEIDLPDLPKAIERLVFTAAIEDPGTLHELGASGFRLLEAGQEKARAEFSGQEFAQEKAIMITELYRKGGEWRIGCVLQGFNEGLAALVRHFGGTVSEQPAAPSRQASVSLEKKLAHAAPRLVELAKKAQVILEKTRLSAVSARVGLVLDGSGSMNGQYKQGRVQELLERLIPLAVHFDDDGALDCWAFGEKPQQLSPVSLANYQGYIDADQGGWRHWALGARVNDEARVLEAVIAFYQRTPARTPVYVLFISDGGVSRSARIKELMVQAAALPIFWQFVGLGGHNYGILERLDEMTGRVVDNCSFFSLDDLHDLGEEALYARLMGEFPDWLAAACNAGILD